MHIVADENIPLLDEFFGDFGRISRYPGRALKSEQVRNADVLLVRSITRVNRELLQGCRVRFVGTCTIGTDHLDVGYLEAEGIHWVSAPGCNARGVLEYVLGALLALRDRTGKRLRERRYGIIGVGHVGGRVAATLQALGYCVMLCDPPRQYQEGGPYVSLKDILQECDVLSLHTPLIHSGDHRTHHLLGRAELDCLRPGAWLINSSRGPVIDGWALGHYLESAKDAQAVLDVWEQEPRVDPALVELCALATPHIAGYSLDGKLRGTEQVYQSLCAFLDVSPRFDLTHFNPPGWLSGLEISGDTDPDWLMGILCRSIYDPRDDDARFRLSMRGSEAERMRAFDELRKCYPLRRELKGLPVHLRNPSEEVLRLVSALGATVVH